MRNWMQASIPSPLKPKKLHFPEERKTQPASPEVSSLLVNSILSAEVQIRFTRSDWERTKAKIVSHNRQLDNQRRKSVQAGRAGSLLETPYIRYTELGRIEE